MYIIALVFSFIPFDAMAEVLDKQVPITSIWLASIVSIIVVYLLNKPDNRKFFILSILVSIFCAFILSSELLDAAILQAMNQEDPLYLYQNITAVVIVLISPFIKLFKKVKR